MKQSILPVTPPPSLVILLSTVLSLLVFLSPAIAATSESKSPAPAEAKKTAVASIPFDTANEQIKTKLRPLTKEELATELKIWLKHVQGEIKKTSELSIQIQDYTKKNESPPKDLKEQRTAQHKVEFQLYKKIGLILDAYEIKGGDASAERQYLKAVAFEGSGSDDQGFFLAMLNNLGEWAISSDGGGTFIKKLLIAIAILMVFYFIAKLANRFFKKILDQQRGISVMLKNFIERSVKGVVLCIGCLFALSALGVQIGPIMAALGAGGFIIGFALKETLGNFASGLMVMFYQPFDVDHFVEVNGTSGKVQKMSLVSTTLLTPDNKELIIPNNSVWGNTIINYSSQSLRRVDLVFGISYGDDIRKAVTILSEITQAHAAILDNPETEIAMDALADSSVNLVCRPWVKSSDYWDVYRELMWIVKDRFDAEGISIPFPQRDLYVHQIEGPKNPA